MILEWENIYNDVYLFGLFIKCLLSLFYVLGVLGDEALIISSIDNGFFFLEYKF